ncbi:hypothetical protein J2X69_003634 [Algoriphagus sp. 4150]|nr:hypothetical protein [Algoriphagus sp. 4150]
MGISIPINAVGMTDYLASHFNGWMNGVENFVKCL